MQKQKCTYGTQRLRPMRVSASFGWQCAARTFVLVDRNVTRNPARYLASIVMRLIGRGITASQIAEQLNLSVKTISTYRTHILEKLGFNTQLSPNKGSNLCTYSGESVQGVPEKGVQFAPEYLVQRKFIVLSK